MILNTLLSCVGFGCRLCWWLEAVEKPFRTWLIYNLDEGLCYTKSKLSENEQVMTIKQDKEATVDFIRYFYEFNTRRFLAPLLINKSTYEAQEIHKEPIHS